MKKIMFNDKYGLTEAVLYGRKTMTRRIATALNHPLVSDISEWGNDDKGKVEITVTYLTGLVQYIYPQYQPGEVVAVAQSYKAIPNPFYGRATNKSDAVGWNNKMFVRAELMPHHIRITNIKVERLRDISSEDCIKEGISSLCSGCHSFYFAPGIGKPYVFPKHAFAALIDRISGKGTWDRNPWVFAYEFEKID